MNWHKGRGRREGGYHHGNLKEALVQAALDLIAQKGPAGFTFAEAARWAGVSPAAPYRHFRDRDELLANVAQQGFEQFETQLAQAWDDGRPDTATAFQRVGKAYLAFARDNPAYYSAMFESGVPVESNPALLVASERAFAVIRARSSITPGAMAASGFAMEAASASRPRRSALDAPAGIAAGVSARNPCSSVCVSFAAFASPRVDAAPFTLCARRAISCSIG